MGSITCLCFSCGSYLFEASSCVDGGFEGTVLLEQNGQEIYSKTDFTDAVANFQVEECAPPTESPSTLCSIDQVTFELVIDPDSKPEEIAWLVSAVNLTENTIGGIAFYSQFDPASPSGTATGIYGSIGGVALCLDCEIDIVVSLWDVAGDGYCCDAGFGEYAIMLNNDLVTTGGRFDWNNKFYYSLPDVCSPPLAE